MSANTVRMGAKNEFYLDAAGREDHIITRVTMPVCDECLIEALGLSPVGQK